MKIDKTRNPLPKKSPPSVKYVNVSVGEHVHGRVDKHIRSLKFVKKAVTKRDWIASAIREKLNSKDVGVDRIPRVKYFNIPVDGHLHQQLEKRIEFIKKFRNYSSKQLVLEAILEKLEREEAETLNLVEKRQSDKN